MCADFLKSGGWGGRGGATLAQREQPQKCPSLPPRGPRRRLGAPARRATPDASEQWRQCTGIGFPAMCALGGHPFILSCHARCCANAFSAGRACRKDPRATRRVMGAPAPLVARCCNAASGSSLWRCKSHTNGLGRGRGASAAAPCSRTRHKQRRHNFTRQHICYLRFHRRDYHMSDGLHFHDLEVEVRDPVQKMTNPSLP